MARAYQPATGRTAVGEDGFAAELDALQRRIDQLKVAEEPAPDAATALVQELESAHEELRVADEEVRTQQAELDRVIEGQRMSRWQHDRLLGLLPAPVVVTDAQGLILTVNAAAAGLLQMSVDRMIRKPLQTFIDTRDRAGVRRRLTRAVTDDSDFRGVVRMRSRGREPIDVELVATLTTDASDTVTEVTWLLLSDSATVGIDPAIARRGALASALVELTQIPIQARDAREVLSAVARVSSRALGEGIAVSVSVGSPTHPDVLGSSSKLAQIVDGAQMMADEGPCQTAWEKSEPVFSADLRTDQRWRRLGVALGQTPVGSVLAVPVRMGDDLVGALNAYAEAPRVVDEGLLEMLQLLGTAVAAILHELDVKEELRTLAVHLETALTSRATIDQAKGMIMAIRGCTSDEAFALLTRISSNRNVKLRDVAQLMVDSASHGRPAVPERLVREHTVPEQADRDHADRDHAVRARTVPRQEPRAPR